MNTRLVRLFMAATIVISNNTKAQDLVLKDSVVIMAPGPQFKASGWKQFWWGKHYRKEWQSISKFPVIDLDATAGGLIPTKRGGGHETKSLRLMGANGREYVLRTIDKSLDVLVPEDFRGTFVNDLVNDQISTAHPYGPLIVAKLSAAAGIYHTNPVIVFVPANQRLAVFSKDFAGKLCLFEERTSGKGWENTDVTGYAEDVVNTEKLIHKLATGNDKKVDQKAFLKVRLFDMWINDWDRHEDQWVWLAHKRNGITIYTAFARDRDQSFSKTDGVNLWLLSRPWAVQSLQNLDSKIKNVIGTTLTARYLDKQFLTELTKDDWKEIIQLLQALLTDTAIRSAVHILPESVTAISQEETIRKLILRRNDMMRFGLKYYDVLNRQVDIVGTDKKEYFTINTITTTKTEITLQKIGNNIAADTIYHKLFNQEETKRIYLYGLGGDDVFLTTGMAHNDIKITIIGGEGKDSFTAKNNNGKINLYDEINNKVKVYKPYKAHFTNDTLFTNYNRRHFQYDYYMPLIIPGYNPDDGIFIGAGLMYRKQSWGKTPYAWQQSFRVSAAIKTGATAFFYNGSFRHAIGKWDVDVSAFYKGPQYVFNYYGYGNDTKLQTDDRSYNRVRVKQLVANLAISKKIGKQELKIGLLAENFQVEETNGKFVSSSTAGLDKIIFDNNTYLGANIGYSVIKKDNQKFPTKGYEFNSSIVYKRNITTGNKDFVTVHGSFSFYLPICKLVLAHRTGASTNIGDFEFYHANTLGGQQTIRGYYRTRFTGKSSFYQNTELRLPLANVKGYVFRGNLGVYGFFDDGRVWAKNDTSDKLHVGYGGGIFFLPFNAVALNISYGSSKEVNIFQIAMDFHF